MISQSPYAIFFSLLLGGGFFQCSPLLAMETTHVQQLPESAPVLRNAESLKTLCIQSLVTNTDLLFTALINVPLDVLDALLTHINRRGTYGGIAHHACLQMAIDSPSIDVERACTIVGKYPTLSCEKLVKRVNQLIQKGERLSPSVINLIVKSFKPAAITSCSFEEMLPAGLTKHPQAAEVSAAFFHLHKEEIQPLNRWIQSFVLRPHGGPLPENLVMVDKDVVFSVLNEPWTKNLALPPMGDANNPIYTRYPAAISSDKKFFAIERINSYVELYQLSQSGTPGFIKYMLTLIIPKDTTVEELTSDELTFSADTEWLLVKNEVGNVHYFRLPTDYLNGNLSLEQLVFIRILQQSTCSRVQQKRLSCDIALAHRLLSSTTLTSFSPAEKNMFTQLINRVHCSEQVRRRQNMNGLEDLRPARIEALLSSYALPGEIDHLGKDLSCITDVRLAKKICKALLTVLKNAHPEQDFSKLKITYKKSNQPAYAPNGSYGKDPAFAEYVKETLHSLGNHYAALLKKMNPQDFKKSLCELILNEVQHYRAY